MRFHRGHPAAQSARFLARSIERNSNGHRVPHRAVPRLEGLEARTLLAIGLDTIPLDTNTNTLVEPATMVTGAGGDLWMANTETSFNGRSPLVRVSTSGNVTDVPMGTIQAIDGLTVGSNGNMWFTGQGFIGETNGIGAPTIFDEAEIKGGAIATGSDGNLWIEQSNTIDRFSVAGVLAEFPLPDSSLTVDAITTGLDANLWFTARGANGAVLGRITTQGTISLFPLPAGQELTSAPTAGPDGSVWFGAGTNLGEISPTGVISIRPVPTNRANGGDQSVTSLVTAPDGTVWFTEQTADVVGRLSPNSTFQQFLVPFDAAQTAYIGWSSYPQLITMGPDRSPWFLRWMNDELVRIDTNASAGAIFAVPSSALSATEGTPFSGTVAELTDTDPSAQPTDFQVSIAWNDDMNLGGPHESTGVVRAIAPGVFSISTSAGFVGSGNILPAMTIQHLVNGHPDGAPLVTRFHFDLVGVPLTSTPLPVIAAPAGTEGRGLVLGEFQDPGTLAGNDSNLPHYSISIDWGDGTSLDQGTTTYDGPPGPFTGYSIHHPVGGFAFGDHTYSNAGTYNVKVTVSEGGDSTSFATSSIVPGVISNASASPIAALEGNSDNWEVASFNDSNPNASASEFSAQVHWSDEIGPVYGDTGEVIATGNGHFVIMETRSFNAAGEIPFTVVVNDGPYSSFQMKATASIADAPLTGQARNTAALIGQAVTTPLGTFSDPDPTGFPSDYAAGINWGDGSTTSSATISQNASGSFSVSGSHSYAAPGTYQIAITITDIKGSSFGATPSTLRLTSTATITSPFLNLSPEPITAIVGNDNNWEVAAFQAADPTATAASYSAKVIWSDDLNAHMPDGSPGSPATVHDLGGGQFLVMADHPLNIAGHFNAHVIITTAYGAQASVDSPVQVAALPLVLGSFPVNATEGQLVSRSLAVFLDHDPNATAGNYSALVNWGDGTTSAANVVRATTDLMPTALPGTSFVVQGTHTYEQAGSFNVSVTVTNNSVIPTNLGQSDSATATTTATIAVAPIVVTPVPLLITPTEGISTGTQTFAQFTEAGTDHSAGDFMALVDWGDHSGSVGTIAETANGFAVQASHVYLDPGTYTVRFIVQGNGQTGSLTESLTVAAVAVPLSGRLAPASDSGASSSDGITNVATPTFQGTTAPHAPVIVIGTAFGGSIPLYIGQTTADASGNWSITTSHLADGHYSFVAYAENAAGRVRNHEVLVASGLVIDTTPPSVTVASFNIASGTVVITVMTGAAGLDASSAMNRGGYVLKATGQGGKTYTRPSVAVSGTPGGPITITAMFNGGRRLAAGQYALSIGSGTLRDLAGNTASGQSALATHATPAIAPKRHASR
jgi:streptogramin lyase